VWNKFALGGGWSAGLGVIHQSDAYTSTSNTVTLPAFTRTDGAIYYAFADGRTRLALNVENLFDKKYYPTAHNDNNISPGAPRNARLTISTRF
jgi:catecholate siderophore receptor